MKVEEINSFLEILKETEKKIDRKSRIQERIKQLRAEVDFGTKMELPDYKMVEIYKPLVNYLMKENRLLLQMQNNELLEDIEGLLELNQHYIRKTKEQFDEIETLRAKNSKQNSPQQIKKINELNEEIKDRDKTIAKQIKKIEWLQEKRKNARELSKKEQKILKLYNTPKKFFLDSKKWYVRPFGYLFRK